MHLPHGLILSNALWSFLLFCVAMGVLWYKIHGMKMEIHTLIERLPSMGSAFVRREIEDLKQESGETRARLTICEDKLGLDGEGQ